MKKFIIPAFMAVALLASCGGAKTQQQNTDSNAETEVTELGVDKNLTSPDLTFYELHGPVKNVKIGDFEESDNYVFIEFTGDGKLYTYDGDKTMFTRTEPERFMVDEESGEFGELPVFKRNGNGEICAIEWYESGSEYIWKNGRNTGYTWASEGTEGKVTYTYNDNGDLIKACEIVMDMESESYDDAEESCVEYKITKRDSYGNWIEREVISEDPWTEKRAIEYYD